MTTKINLTELMADRQAGTGGDWEIDYGVIVSERDEEVAHCGEYRYGDIEKTERSPADARRIARLPALEAAYIEAVEALRKITNARSVLDGGSINECRQMARKFLGDGE